MLDGFVRLTEAGTLLVAVACDGDDAIAIRVVVVVVSALALVLVVDRLLQPESPWEGFGHPKPPKPREGKHDAVATKATLLDPYREFFLVGGHRFKKNTLPLWRKTARAYLLKFSRHFITKGKMHVNRVEFVRWLLRPETNVHRHIWPSNHLRFANTETPICSTTHLRGIGHVAEKLGKL